MSNNRHTEMESNEHLSWRNYETWHYFHMIWCNSSKTQDMFHHLTYDTVKTVGKKHGVRLRGKIVSTRNRPVVVILERAIIEDAIDTLAEALETRMQLQYETLSEWLNSYYHRVTVWTNTNTPTDDEVFAHMQGLQININQIDFRQVASWLIDHLRGINE